MRRVLNFAIAVATIYCAYLLITTDFRKVQLASLAEMDVTGSNQFFVILGANVLFFLIYLYGYHYVRAWTAVHNKPRATLYLLQLMAVLILTMEAYALNEIKKMGTDAPLETLQA